MAPVIIDNEIKLQALLVHMQEHLGGDRLIFVDLEGVDLSRSGVVAIMQLLMPPEPIVYLVDIHVLGAVAFKTTIANGTSLKSILESRSVFKVFFDIRNDSDALYAHFDINVAGIIDLQVIEYATRQPQGRFVNGLARCVERDLPYVAGWSVTKAKGRRLFAPEVGGKYEVFLERPLPSEIVEYCEQDVMLMPQLLAQYGPKLHPSMAAQIQTIVDERVQLSKTVTYNGKGRQKAIGPHLSVARPTNMQTSPEVDLVCSHKLRQMCQLDDELINDVVSRFDAVQLQESSKALDTASTSPEDTASVTVASAVSTRVSSV